jgi:putative flavoprotein involved in K+ transport
MDTTTVVIGAGHAGLAMSRRLTERSIDHVVLERGEVANSWQTERWDSLRLLTPNWLSRLPAMPYTGDDPAGFMTMAEVVSFVRAYADRIGAPVHTGTTVSRVSRTPSGYEVTTDRGTYTCKTVVVASGAANVAKVPAVTEGVPASVAQLTPLTYRSPEQLDDRGVLIVGASATGVQLADEIQRSGRPVTLAAGEHVRMPRTYRGRDIFWWLESAGVLAERFDQVDDLVRARHVPSPQLIGSSDGRSIDLNSLRAIGVDITGRLGSVRAGVALCSGGLANVCRLADLKLGRLLDRFDAWAERAGADVAGTPERCAPTTIPDPALQIDLRRSNIGTVIWATGFRPDYSWLDVPVLDRKGRLRHEGGVVSGASGLYLLGGNLLRTRRSSYLAGAEADTEAIAAHLHDYLCIPHRRDRLSPPQAVLAETSLSRAARTSRGAISSGLVTKG